MADQTEYAKRYGVARHYSTGTALFGPPGPEKSALTPLSPNNPATHLSQNKIEERADIEDHQRRILKGFTSRELFDLDAITNRPLSPLTINTPSTQSLGEIDVSAVSEKILP
jgi:hypothetical protein